MKVAITGGAGFIGSHLAHTLIHDHEVIVLDNLSTGRRMNIEHLSSMPDFHFIEATITDLPLLRSICDDVDVIFHQAAYVSVPGSVHDPMISHEVNGTGTLNVLIAARDAHVRKVIVASSAAVYGDSPVVPKREEMTPDPKSPYAVSKVTGEYYCRIFTELYDLPTVCLRYFNVYGARQDPHSPYAAVIPSFLSRLLKGERIIIHGNGEQTRDFIHVHDVVRANFLAMEKNVAGTFNIASGNQTSIKELAHLLMEIVDNEQEPLYEPPRLGDIRDSYADISHARRNLGFEPQYPLKKGLVETAAWFAQYYCRNPS